jgi:hypothetical protein
LNREARESGAAWQNVLDEADKPVCLPQIDNQDDRCNVTVLAQALVFVRTGDSHYYNKVETVLDAVASYPAYTGRALALGRELGAYVLAADIVDLRNKNRALNERFRNRIADFYNDPTPGGGPDNLVECHEKRPNNWGTHCGATRLIIAVYLEWDEEVARIAEVFHGWLGDRETYSGFSYGDLDWQSDPDNPVGINPKGATIQGYNVDGVVPDDQRRGGGFVWPPPCEGYVRGAFQGITVTALVLHRYGISPFIWEHSALRRGAYWYAFVANCEFEGDDEWSAWLFNYMYSDLDLPAVTPASPGKNMGWTDWTHQ